MKALKQKDGHPLCVGVLMGGCSSEREISLKSGNAVAEALRIFYQNVKKIIIDSCRKEEISEQIQNEHIDLAFIALHGQLGEDGVIQEILERFTIPYTGSGIQASCIALNKILTYQRLLENEIRVPRHIIFRKGENLKKFLNKDIAFPLVVKPCSGGSSIGINIVHFRQDLPEAMDIALSYGEEVLLDEYIPGKELTVAVLGNKLLPVVEIQPQKEFFDFAAKYQAGLTRYIVPAQIDSYLSREAQNIALAAHRVIGCRHFSRVDIVLDDNQKCYVLEVNTIPGFTSTSLLPKAAQAIGINFEKLCFLLTQMAYEEKNKKKE